MTYLSNNLFSQTALFKKATSKRSFFYFSAASGTLHKYLHIIYCCWQHKFSIKSLLCNTQYFSTVLSDTKVNNTLSTLFCVFAATMVTRPRHTVTLYAHCFLFCIKPGGTCSNYSTAEVKQRSSAPKNCPLDKILQ
jgi:hypothetical protein